MTDAGALAAAIAERDKALAALGRFVSAGKGGSKSLDDAKKRLAEPG